MENKITWDYLGWKKELLEGVVPKNVYFLQSDWNDGFTHVLLKGINIVRFKSRINQEYFRIHVNKYLMGLINKTMLPQNISIIETKEKNVLIEGTKIKDISYFLVPSNLNEIVNISGSFTENLTLKLPNMLSDEEIDWFKENNKCKIEIENYI